MKFVAAIGIAVAMAGWPIPDAALGPMVMVAAAGMFLAAGLLDVDVRHLER